MGRDLMTWERKPLRKIYAPTNINDYWTIKRNNKFIIQLYRHTAQLMAWRVVRLGVTRPVKKLQERKPGERKKGKT
jgi:hypothetical protein